MATTGICPTAPLRDDDVELELGLSLSIGRSYKKAPLNDAKIGFEPVVSGLAGESARSGLDAQMEVDAREKREVQALKRKREVKRLVRKGALSNGVCHNGGEEHPPKTKMMKTVNLNLSVEQNDGGLNDVPVGNAIRRPVVAYLNGGYLGLVHDGHDSEREESSGKDWSYGSPAVTSSACSDYRRSTCREENGGADSEIKTVASNASSSSLNGPNLEAEPASAPESPRKHVSLLAKPIPGGTREMNGDRGRPPRPQSQGNAASALSSMPCVSTTGNGPNGKTVNGLLYRYATTEEVSIICICHRTSFSPVEFVHHAGGTGVSNPLRHITMVATSF